MTVGLVASLVVPGLAAGPEGELADAERRIDELSAELDRLAETRSQRAAVVAETRDRVADLEAVLNDTLSRIDRQRSRVEQISGRVASTEEEVAVIEQVLGERARALYMHQLSPELSAAMSGGDVQAVVDRLGALEVVTGRDRASVEMLTATRTRLEQERELLVRQRSRLEAMREEQEVLVAQVSSTLAEQSADLAAVEAREAALAAEREQLEDDSERLEELIEARRARAERDVSIAPPGSGYMWPLCRTVTSEYGPRWGRMHEGIDIDGGTGDSIRAANDGIVISAGWNGGYGRLTLVDHGDGVVTAYAHQSRIDVARGQRVSRGQVIGAVGATGNVTGAHLHYETRVGGRATNPRQYLPQGC